MFVPIGTPDSVTAVDPHHPGAHVVVVPYLAELKDGQSLSEWTEMYESLGHASDRATIQRQPRRVFRVNGAKAVHEEGVSPLTTYQFTNIARKNMVWDVWTNIPSTDPLATIYDRMVRSFRFGHNSPRNLRDAYGSGFLPMEMEEAIRLSTQGDEIESSSVADGHSRPNQTQAYVQLTSAWKSPVLNASYGPRTVRCGSTKHTNTSSNAYSKYAADISAGSLTNVYASMAGTVTFAGMKNNGFGNLVTIR